MAEKEYIERGALNDILEARAKMAIGTPVQVYYSAASMVQKLPAADVVEVKHGRWVKLYRTMRGIVVSEDIVCSNCQKEAETLQAGGGCYLLSDYCPHCGTRMDGN